MEKKYISTKQEHFGNSSFSKVFIPALNASCFLLEHQWIYEPFLIVLFESLN